MESSDEDESPRGVGGKMRESHKSLPHHDSLRELELKEARAERKSKKTNSTGSDSNNNNNIDNNSSNNNRITNFPSGMITNINGEAQASPPTPSESSNSSLLKEGDPLRKKQGNIVSVADIEISPQEQLHVQDTLDPEIHRTKKKKKKKKLNEIIRRKPAVEDKTPRRIHFNDPARNASYKYANNSISTTKYTPITFVPKNLLEQFRRIANFYFLVIAMIQLIPGLSPVSAYSSIIPLVIVLGVTMIKEGIEDWKRYLSDRDTNNYQCNALRGNEFAKVAWSKVSVGDILKVYNGERIPADMVLLNSSETQGLCYVETSNLDGETNLKLYQAIPETTAYATEPELSSVSNAFIECERPNNRLYTFSGFMEINGEKKSLAAKQVLLRGCLLKNTQWITGLIVYTGFDTKLMQNATSPPSKRTSLEKKTNKALMIIFSFMLLVCIIGGIGAGVWTRLEQDDTWYVPPKNSAAVTGLLNFISFLISFSVMIPISLYVSMEMVKVAQALFIGQDMEMYYAENDTPAKARTSNLSEELGQIEYIFSDKTGTLTRNIMEFFKCSIGGVSYGTGLTEIAITKAKREGRVLPTLDSSPLPGCDPKFAFNDRRLLEDLKKEGQREKIMEFFTLLSVCHTVIPERDPKDESKIKYQAASPDEATLVDAARNLGFFFHTRNPRDIICNIMGEDVQFNILNVLEFNSTRKRMSVITKDLSSGKIRLHCKGADTVIYERLKDGQQDIKEQTVDHLEDFASDGLRTLCLAWREITQEEYDSWNEKFHEANIAIDDRENKLMAAAELIEKDMNLIGATAIEDKLQEGVPDAIYTLAQAEIKIWVLTGDHQETAINIGFACSLLTSTMTIMIINAGDATETERQLLAAISQSEEEGEYGLVIDGYTLQHALDPGRNLRLLQLAKRCTAVICCRVSPLQKAQVVALVKDNLRATTLAIGDGANDVSMIQQAHIGIGISGQEGMQAVMNSDYAIAQFRFLTRLLLIHGRSDYKRVSKLILYSFYKNMVFSLCQFPINWFNGFSAQTMYDSWSITIFNIVFTGLPIILYSIFDQDVTPKMVYQYPQMYETGQKNMEFNMKLLLYWLGTGVYQAFIVFFGVYLIWDGATMFTNGQTGGIYMFGAFCYFAVILTVNVRLALETRYWTVFTYISLIGCTVIWFPWMAIVGGSPVFITDSIMYYVPFHLFTSGMFWLGVLFICAVCMAPVVAIEFLRRQLRPQNYQIVQELKRLARMERERRAIEMGGGRIGIFRYRKPVKKSFAPDGTPIKPDPNSLDLESRFTGYAFSPDDDVAGALGHEFKNQNTSQKNTIYSSSSNNNIPSDSSSSSKGTTLPFPPANS